MERDSYGRFVQAYKHPQQSPRSGASGVILAKTLVGMADCRGARSWRRLWVFSGFNKTPITVPIEPRHPREKRLPDSGGARTSWWVCSRASSRHQSLRAPTEVATPGLRDARPDMPASDRHATTTPRGCLAGSHGPRWCSGTRPGGALTPRALGCIGGSGTNAARSGPETLSF